MLKRVQIVLLVFVLVSTFSCTSKILDSKNYSITFVKVGQGDCCLITTPGGRRILIDSGASVEKADKTPIVKYCSINGIKKIDIAIASHYHEDHIGGMIKLFEKIPCSMVLLPNPSTKEDNDYRDKILLNARNAKAYYFNTSEKIGLGENLEITSLYENKSPQTTENESSMLIKLTCYKTSIIYTGDIGFETEKDIIKKLPADVLQSDIIKVAHHGSKYSSSDEFYNVIKPKDAIICVGKNTFGHPSDEAISRIENSGAKLHRTDLNGTVNVKINKNGYSF